MVSMGDHFPLSVKFRDISLIPRGTLSHVAVTYVNDYSV